METNIHTTFRSTRFSLRERRMIGQTLGPREEAGKLADEAEDLQKHPDEKTADRVKQLQDRIADLLKNTPGDQIADVTAKLNTVNDIRTKLEAGRQQLAKLKESNAKELKDLAEARDKAGTDKDKPDHPWVKDLVDGALAVINGHEVAMAVLVPAANRPLNVVQLLEEHAKVIDAIRKLAPGNAALQTAAGAADEALGGGLIDEVKKKNAQIILGDKENAAATDLEKSGLREVVAKFKTLKNSTNPIDKAEADRMKIFIKNHRDVTVDTLLGHIREISLRDQTKETDEKRKFHIQTIAEIQSLSRDALGVLDTGSTAPTAKPGDVVNETAKKAFTKLVAAVTEKKNITDATVTAPLAEINTEFQKLDEPKRKTFFEELKKELVSTAFEPALNTPTEIKLVVRTPAPTPAEEAKLTGLAKTIFDFLETTEKTFGVDLSPFKQLLKTPGGAIALDEKNEVSLTATLDNLRKERDRTDDAIRILKRNPRVDRAKLRELQDRLQRIDDAIEAIEADDKLSPDEKVKARQILRQLRDINRDAEDLGFNVQFHFQPGLSPFASVHSPVRPFGVNPYAYGPRYGAYQRPPYAAPYSQPGSTYIAGDYSYGKTSGSNKGPA